MASTVSALSCCFSCNALISTIMRLRLSWAMLKSHFWAQYSVPFSCFRRRPRSHQAAGHACGKRHVDGVGRACGPNQITPFSAGSQPRLCTM